MRICPTASKIAICELLSSPATRAMIRCRCSSAQFSRYGASGPLLCSARPADCRAARASSTRSRKSRSYDRPKIGELRAACSPSASGRGLFDVSWGRFRGARKEER